MTTLLHAVARKAEATTPDADLLARFTRDRDHAAFDELVRRHGPLVWAVCRHLLPDHADAEDAFQAVFLALVRSAATIRDGRTVPAWLHGVAVRIATRAKRSGARRRRREQVASLPESERPVASATWDALVRSVHEEVQQLPDVERTAFVLCDLEGVSQSDAAARLGWPLGSLSGRLCKARQRLVERLSARGVAPAAALGIGMTASAAGAVPGRLFNVVRTFPGTPTAASSAASVLARGFTEGIAMRVKLMMASVVITALGLTGGAALLSKADAQPPTGTGGGAGGTSSSSPGSGPGGAGGSSGTSGSTNTDPLGTGGTSSAGGSEDPGTSSTTGTAGPSGSGSSRRSGAAPAAAWDYKFVDVKGDRKAFETAITQHGKDGWEFCSSERFGQSELVLVFKKSKGGAGGFNPLGGFGGGGGFSQPGGGGFGGSGFPGGEGASGGGFGQPGGGGRSGGGGGGSTSDPERGWMMLQRLTNSTGDTVDLGAIPPQTRDFMKGVTERAGGIPLPEKGTMTKDEYLKYHARNEAARAAAAGGGSTSGGDRAGGSGFGRTDPLGTVPSGPRANPNPDALDPNLFRVVVLKHANADIVVNALQKEFEKKGFRCVAERTANAVVIIASAPDDLRSALKRIAELDAKPAPGGTGGAEGGSGFGGSGAPGKPEAAFNVFPLKHANAVELVTVLQKLFPNGTLTADRRTNSLVLRGDAETLEIARALIARLDVEVTKPK